MQVTVKLKAGSDSVREFNAQLIAALEKRVKDGDPRLTETDV